MNPDTENLVRLETHIIPLAEVEVRPIDPLALIRLSIEKIPQNYHTIPLFCTGFYREITKDNDRYTNFSESVLSITKVPGNTKKSDVISMVKSREEKGLEPPLIFQLNASGPESLLESDAIKTASSFFNRKEYDYEYAGTTVYQNKLVYIIRFDQKDKIRKRLFEGLIYIDRISHAIIDVTYSYSKKGMPYSAIGNKTKLILKTAGLTLDLKKYTCTIHYENYNHKWVLNSIVASAEMDITSKRENKHLTKTISQQLLLMDFDTTPLSGKDTTPQTQESHKNMPQDDEHFWERYNILLQNKMEKGIIKELQKADNP